MTEVDIVRLELATSPETCIYEGTFSNLHANYAFDRILGIDLEGSQLGEAGESTTVLYVPQTWAHHLVSYVTKYVLVGTRLSLFRKNNDFAKHPRTNCHGFANFMTGSTIQTYDELDEMITFGERIVNLQTEPRFGEWLAFGTQGPPEDITLRFKGHQGSEKRFNEAYHSAIALGEVSSGSCIQVSSDRGCLSLDNLEKYQNYVGGFDTFDDDLSWYRHAATI